MIIKNEFNRYGEELESLLRLQTSPIAVRMLERESEIPSGSLRPQKDKKKHFAQCQVFSLSRRDNITVAMLKEDNWCPAPLIAYGHVPQPDDPAAKSQMKYECFRHGAYIGILTAPLRSASFKPDVVLIYCDTNQLRKMLLSLKEEDRSLVKSNFFPFSCAYSVTNPVIKNEYWINLPDPGEYVRALTQTGEMIFSIPGKRMSEFMEGFRKFDSESMFSHEQMMMVSDFPQPDLYKKIFESWGMDYEK